jgi:ABC-type lipopolysaccharide export system ATPase subunit
VMSSCDRVVVMREGAVLFEGTPAEVQQSEQVQVAYLGGSVGRPESADPDEGELVDQAH